MLRFFLIFIVFTLFSGSVIAEYNVNNNCKNAWMLLMDLQIDKAKDLLKKEIEQNPDNYYAYYLDQTCDAYATIINTNEQRYNAFVDNYEKRRELMDDKDVDSPYYLACLAEMQLQTGIFNILKGDNISGLRKAYSAYKNTYKNLKKYPEFKQSLKIDGFFNVAISNVPPFVKWAVSFFGVSADQEYGFKLLYDNYESQRNINGLNAESALFIILTAKINKTPEMVYEFTRSLDTNISNTTILKYFKANIAYRTGRNEEALSNLEQINSNTSLNAKILYSYLMGKILLRKLDNDAYIYINNYLDYIEKDEYVKEMNYSLAIYYLINNNKLLYAEYCEVVVNTGKDVNERDREAQYDATLDYIPDKNLTEARLLLDGGYNSRFLQKLKAFESLKNDLLVYKLENELLKGRYNVVIGNANKAITNFSKVIELGKHEKYYFASEAALRLGNLYQKNGKTEDANKYFELSLKLYSSNYYEYIEDKARKGLRANSL